jgi:signal peptidase I
MLKLLKVSGDSLQPLYQAGDFVLLFKIPSLFGMVKPGDVIVFRHEAYGVMIKMVECVVPDKDEIFVAGTHDDSVDSRRFGAISNKEVIGKVIWHIKRIR